MSDSNSPRDSSSKGTASAPREETPRRELLERTKPPREWRTAHPPTPPSTGGAAEESGLQTPGLSLPAGQPSSALRTESSVGGARTTPPQEAAVADMGPPIPQQYGIDRLVLLVRDPHWTYAWWELTETHLDRARRDLGTTAQLVLRFYDVSAIDWDGHNHHASFDIEVHDLAGNWYVELGQPGAAFVAELGLRGADGRFVRLVRSNVVAMPRDSMSPVADERWMIQEEEYRRLFELSGGDSIGIGSGEILRALEERLRRELLAGGVSSFGVSSLASRRDT